MEDDGNWQELVDIKNLRLWMDSEGLASGKIEDIELLGGGTQNVLLRFRRGGQGFVLRRPSQFAGAKGDETIQRETRVLRSLKNSNVPHAALIAACLDPTILGAAFYLMEPVSGFNATVALPPLHAGDPAIRRQMGFALIEGLLKLGAINPAAVDLMTFGRIDGFMERQVERWFGQLRGYAEHQGWPGTGDLVGIEEIAAWLEAHRPPSFVPGIMHGDYHLANVMFETTGPELAAIVDWELATVGDPLIDLGWVLATWPDEHGMAMGQAMVTPWEGFPSAEELIEHYRAGSFRELSAIRWYRVFACYKLAILLEGTFARACAGKAGRETGERLHRNAVGLVARAYRLISAL